MLTLPQMLRRTPWCRRHGPREQPRRGRGVVNTSVWDFRRRGPLCNEVSYKLPMPWDSIAKQIHCSGSSCCSSPGQSLRADLASVQLSSACKSQKTVQSYICFYLPRITSDFPPMRTWPPTRRLPPNPANPTVQPTRLVLRACIASGLRSWHASQRTGWPVAQPCMANKAFRNRTACRHANQLSRRVAWDCDPPPIGPKHAKLMIRWF